MHLQESGQMYLESIYVLTKRGGQCRSVDVGEYLGYSKPSVSRAMGLLKKGGFIEVNADGTLVLTRLGREVAETMYERHTLLTDLLTRLGVPKEIASEDACKIEHAISEQSFAAIKKWMISQ